MVHIGESLFQVREDGGVQVQGLAVLFDKAGGIVGDGLALRAAISSDYDLNVHRWVAGCRAMSFMGREPAGRGPVQGLGVAGVQLRTGAVCFEVHFFHSGTGEAGLGCFFR